MTLTKSLLTVVALAAPLVMSAGVLAPAQAAPISAGSSVTLSSFPARRGNPGTTVQYVSSPNGLDFNGPLGPELNPKVSVISGTGAFLTVAANANTEIKDLTFNGVSGSSQSFVGNIGQFIDGIRLSSAPGAEVVNFRLKQFLYNATTGAGDFSGVFRNAATGQTIDAIGAFSTQFVSGASTSTPSSFSMTITAVPTPAALPALIGFGVGLVRKRKAAALAEAEA